MVRQQFNSRNNIGQILSFQKSGSTSSFDPLITFSSGSGLKRVSWKLNNGVEVSLVAGNSIVYTGFTSDTSIREIQMRGNSFKNLNQFILNNDNIYGNLDLSLLPDLIYISLSDNPNLTGITHTSSSQIFTVYQALNCNLTGDLNLPFSGLGGNFNLKSNPNLTGITHTPSSQVFTVYQVNSCDLTGDLNLPFSKLGGQFRASSNPNLTGITHTPSSQVFTTYQAFNCNLTGDLNLPFSGLGGDFRVYANPNLTGITHTPSSQLFTTYQAFNCDLTGNLNLPFSGLGGDFNLQSNPNLTGITHTASTQIFTNYNVNNCNLTGNHNLSWFPNLGGVVSINGNSLLTSITHTASTKNFTQYNIHQNNISGTHDISMFSNFGGSSTGSTCYATFYLNPNLTDITFPTTNGYFKNFTNTESQGALGLYSCNLNYVDFRPLSGVTFLTGTTQGNPRVNLRDNGMIAGDVNHILDDFLYNATNNPTGWSNIVLNIGGTNISPDSSSGGYDGLAAIATLTGSPYNWTITY